MKIPKKIEDRLKYIDFLLFFCGSLNRKQLTEEFGIQTAGATRDLSKYKEIASENLTYDHVQRIYFATDDFQPVYRHDPNAALMYFSQTEKFEIHCEITTILRPLRTELLAFLTRAMFAKRAVHLTYHNPKTGTKERTFVPHNLVHDGLRWHVRGFCRLRAKFIDLVISRIEGIEILGTEIDHAVETVSSDRQWNRYVDLEIVPHPKVPHPEAIAYEHQMHDSRLIIEVRAAVAGYFLRSWNVDCSKDHRLDPRESTLWLKNIEALYRVSNLVIAPGYED